MTEEKWRAIAMVALFVIKTIAKPALILFLFPIVVLLGVLGFTVKSPR
jgi:hypothetical protein